MSLNHKIEWQADITELNRRGQTQATNENVKAIRKKYRKARALIEKLNEAHGLASSAIAGIGLSNGIEERQDEEDTENDIEVLQIVN